MLMSPRKNEHDRPITRAMLLNRVVRTTTHMYSFLKDRGVDVLHGSNSELLDKAILLGYLGGDEFVSAHKDLATFDSNRR